MVLSVFLSSLLLISCANLSQINNFATVSVKALASENSIGYSFTQSCTEFDCAIKNAMPIYYYPTVEQLRVAFGPGPVCNCDSFKNADKTLTTMNAVLTAYLTGLANLSDSKTVNYNYSNLVSAINANDTKFKLSGDEVTSLGKIATVISNDLMNTYRRNKLKKIIPASDPDIQIIITAYVRGLNYFEKFILKNDQDFLTNWYSGYLKDNDTKLSPIEKAKIYQDYLDQKAKLLSYQSLVDNYVAALKKIQSGHAELAKDAGAFNETNAKEAINAYSADIFSLISDFNQLKSKK